LFKEQSVPTPALQLSRTIILPVVVTLVVMFGLIARLVIVSQKRKPTTGAQGLIGEEGVASTDIDGRGKVFVHGEYWDVSAAEKIDKGARVRVTGIEGLVLSVEPTAKGSNERE
jgi:membrane-bound serine protease (ClpP class)